MYEEKQREKYDDPDRSASDYEIDERDEHPVNVSTK